MERRFHRSPKIEPSTRFVDEQGKNPFGDSEKAVAASDNPYQSSAENRMRPYEPGDFETLLQGRPRLVVRLGVAGFLSSVAGWIALAVGFLRAWDLDLTFLTALPTSMLGVTLAAPAWGFGWSDLRAMNAGAMESDGRRKTAAGYWLGLLGTLLGLATVGVLLAAPFLDVFSA